MTNMVKQIKKSSTDPKSKLEDALLQISQCIHIESSTIYIHSEIDFGSLFDLINSVNVILSCRAISEIGKPITIDINSPGGDVYEMLAMIDFIKSVPVKINVHVSGYAMSAAAVILACATGKRTCRAHSTVMLHESFLELSGKISDTKTNMTQLHRLEDIGNKLLAESTKKPAIFWEKNLSKDMYLTPEKALEYGIIDEII